MAYCLKREEAAAEFFMERDGHPEMYIFLGPFDFCRFETFRDSSSCFELLHYVCWAGAETLKSTATRFISLEHFLFMDCVLTTSASYK